MDHKEAWAFLDDWSQDPIKVDEHGYNQGATLEDLEKAAEAFQILKKRFYSLLGYDTTKL